MGEGVGEGVRDGVGDVAGAGTSVPGGGAHPEAHSL